MNIVQDSQAKAVAPAPSAELIAWLHATFTSLLRSIGTFAVPLGPRAMPLYTRLQRARNRITVLLTKLAALIAAGKTPRPARPRIRLAPQNQPPRPTIPPEQRIPTRFNWLGGALDHIARGHANNIRIILADPAHVAAIAQSPGTVRTLRPICRLFGIDLPEALRLPPRPPRPPRKRKPSQRPRPGGSHLLQGDRPLPKYVLDAARAWRRRDESRALMQRDSKTA